MLKLIKEKVYKGAEMKTYRKNTAAIILNAENEILLFQRADLPQIWGSHKEELRQVKPLNKPW